MVRVRHLPLTARRLGERSFGHPCFSVLARMIRGCAARSRYRRAVTSRCSLMLTKSRLYKLSRSRNKAVRRTGPPENRLYRSTNHLPEHLEKCVWPMDVCQREPMGDKGRQPWEPFAGEGGVYTRTPCRFPFAVSVRFRFFLWPRSAGATAKPSWRSKTNRRARLRSASAPMIRVPTTISSQ